MTDKASNNLFEKSLLQEANQKSGMALNFKRVLARAIRYWYLVVLCMLSTLTIAFLVNRYTTRIYTVTASIIVREGDENAGAKFLYNNPLVNPYRNFFNELYIMRSYPLLQEVVEHLNYHVTWHREGNFKTSEVYDNNFPVKISVLSDSLTYGQSIGFEATSENNFSLHPLTGGSGKILQGLSFNDTITINGYKLLVIKVNSFPNGFINKHFVVNFSDPFVIAKQYSARLNAQWAEQGASVVNLAISGPIAQKEIQFLSKFIESYQQYDVDKKNLVATKSIEFLDKQLSNIGDSLRYFDDRIEDFKESNLATNFDIDAQRIFQHLEDLETQKAQMLLYNNYFEYLEKYIRQSKDNDQIVPPSAIGITDNVISNLITQLTELQFSLRVGVTNETNPLVVQQRQKVKQLKKDILEGVKSIKATQKLNLASVNKQVEDAKKELARLPASERALLDIKRNYTIRENMYLFLMQKRAEAGISRASATSDIITVNPPSQSGGPITPKPVQNYTIALAGGLLLPFIFFILGELVNDRIQSKEDIEQITSIPLIGGIGHNAQPNNLVVFNKPKSAMAESFRTLRSNLNYFTRSQDKKIILITSSVSGEGKTFTTINLATALAFTGKRVLIIGADMRKPKIFSDFNLDNEVGLSTYLSSMSDLKQVIRQTPIENLSLMSAGPVPPNPSELLMSQTTEEMLQELLQKFDFILLDTPPIGLVSDALSLMKFAHHTIFMVRQDYTPRQFLTHIQELFDKREIKNISILFNDIRRTGPGYGYGYGYGYSYDYGYTEKNDKEGYYED